MNFKLIISICILSLFSFKSFAKIGDGFWCAKLYFKASHINIDRFDFPNNRDNEMPENITITILDGNLLEFKSKNGIFKFKFIKSKENLYEYYSVDIEHPYISHSILRESSDFRGRKKNDGVYFYWDYEFNKGFIKLNKFKCTKL